MNVLVQCRAGTGQLLVTVTGLAEQDGSKLWEREFALKLEKVYEL
jgi:hypothetical protein